MATKNGTIWSETPAGQQLQQRLADEETLRGLDHLLARITTLETAVERLAIAMEQGPGLISMAADTVDETVRQAAQRGIYMEDRVQNTVALLEKLTRPEVTHQLSALLDLADRSPGLIAMGMDTLDEQMRQAGEKGIDLQKIASLTGSAAAALSEASEKEPAKVGGVFGLLRALNDKDRQKGLGFLMNFLKFFGQKMG
ncbi:MAG TPA: DUF1641 domain-containing protein [Saprospiraceae bacterium]|nr:DUF1641 domain-containing protein [Saprospiraceae bacterium]